MYLADTKVAVDNIKNNKKDRIYICETTIFEILKNKPDSERRAKFRDIVDFCKRTNSDFLLSDTSMRLVNIDFFGGYLYALQICNKTAKKMAEMLFDFLRMIITLVQLLMIRDFKSEDRIKKSELIIQNTNLVLVDLKKKCVNLIYKAFLDNSSHKNERDLVEVYNGFVRDINAHSFDKKFQLKTIKHLSICEMVKGGPIKQRIKYIEEYVNKVLTFEKESEENKLFFKSYLIYLFTEKNIFEINDLIDINLCFAAYKNNLELITTDNNLNNTYGNLIKIKLISD